MDSKEKEIKRGGRRNRHFLEVFGVMKKA